MPAPRPTRILLENVIGVGALAARMPPTGRRRMTTGRAARLTADRQADHGIPWAVSCVACACWLDCLDRNVRIDTVLTEENDRIDSQPLERSLDRLPDVCWLAVRRHE